MAVLQILAVRYAVQPVILVPYALATRRSLTMSPRLFALTLLRTLLHMGAIWMMFTALIYLPLAEAIAIAYVEPFIMMLLGHYLLKEMVGSRRFIACVVGFIGVLLVVQPTFAAVGWPALLPVGVAIAFAFFLIVTRVIAKEADPVSLQAVSGMMACAIFAAAFLLLPSLEWMPVADGQWPLLIAVGIFGTFAHLAMTGAMRFAPAATLAPTQYLEIPFATIIGWVIFSEFPNGLAGLGIAITLASGLYILHREHKAEQTP
ncbi:MAG: DMT family transporter, partial [Pseudomonadota bacterium]